jgi:hypothetical protein
MNLHKCRQMAVCCTSHIYVLYIGRNSKVSKFKNGSRHIVFNSFCFWVALNSFGKIHLTAIFEVMRAVLMSIQFSWNKMHIQLLYSYRSFGGVFLLCHLAKMFLEFFDPKCGNILLLRNFKNYLRCDTTSYYRGNEFLSSPGRVVCLFIFCIFPYLHFLPQLVLAICVCS